jgi:hypothetical protein
LAIFFSGSFSSGSIRTRAFFGFVMLMVPALLQEV